MHHYQKNSCYPKSIYYILCLLSSIFLTQACQSDTNSANSNPAELSVFAEKEGEKKQAYHLLNTKFQSLFGKKMSVELIQYNRQLEATETVEDVAITFEKSMNLRDTIVDIIGAYTDQIHPDSLPDLFWLKEVMPTQQPQLVAEGTAYYLFSNYKEWLKIAQKTPSKEDDEFIALNLLLFPEDSIEYFYPAWFIQTWDYGGSSLLGRSIHQQILRKLSNMLPKTSSPIFQKEMQRIKEDLLNDILSSENTYWERKSVILVELDSMIQLKYPILSENDRIALQKRREEFNAPEKYGIKLNQQAGVNN